MISIIHPSRSRPEKSWKTCQEWMSKAHCDVELIISLDSDDPRLKEYKFPADIVIVNHNRSAVDAINNAAKIANGDILIVVSDDTECFYGWGKAIEKLTVGKTDWVIKTQDGIQPWLITMPIMDRIYYDRFGYIYHPDYTHCFCDTELTLVADLLQRKIESNYSFPHAHHSIGRAEKDYVSERADSTFESGKKVFIGRRSNLFGINETIKPGHLDSIMSNVYMRLR